MESPGPIIGRPRYSRRDRAPVALALIGVGIAFSMVIAAKLVWFRETEPWNTVGYFRLWLLTQACYILALLCLPLEDTRPFGVSVACFTSVGYTLVQGGVTAFTTLLIGLSLKPWIFDLYKLLWMWITAHVLILVSSVRWLAKTEMKVSAFAWGVVPPVLFAISLGAIYQSQYQAGLSPSTESVFRKNQAAHDIVMSISWCAIQYRQQHPEAGYPRSIEVLRQFECNRKWSLSDAPRYRVFYQLVNISGSNAHFNVQASFEDPSKLYIYDSDESGLVYSRVNYGRGRELSNPGDEFGGPSRPLEYEYRLIASLDSCLQGFARYNPAEGYPAELNELLAHEIPTASCSELVYDLEKEKQTYHLGENSIRGANYEFIYLPDPVLPSGQRHAFKLYARCQAYAKTCIRNLYVNQTGDVHGTSEDREATRQDPVEQIP